ncbi:sulfotransferase [Nocardioides sp. URHA0020]|uniref:sulfotransferase n=1 Tax=Nocardioides sp. URHA0020 TaxID=1380392 RepID=UPI00048EC21F|nr:sulfotransferase [Nocardioides sp. URHA0020]
MTTSPTRFRPARSQDRLRPGARALRDVVGRATAQRRALPSLLIIGGQRCGTTSLYKALAQQPHLFRPVWRKGVHYFDVSYERGSDWYRSHFPYESTVARAAARHHTEALCFESSPYYMFHPAAAHRIRSTLPGVRVVVLVRDPVERAYSAHAHELARGFETLPFEAALAAEDDRLSGEEERMVTDPRYSSPAHRHQAYRTRGEYAPQLERLAGILGRDRIHVIDSHRFFQEPEPVFADLLGWLGTRVVTDPAFDRHNARVRLPLADSVRQDLQRHFEPYDEQLGEWLGRAPSWRV